MLRPYQIAAIAGARAEYARGVNATLLVLATGLGKTVIAAEVMRLIVAAGGRALFVAHREELLDQAAAKIAALGITAGIEQASRRAAPDAPVVIASVQTLQKARLAAWDPDAFKVLIVDEAHHGPARSYASITGHFRARVLGLTATPDRADGTPLAKMFQSVAYRYDIREAIHDGYLSPITARRIVVDDIDLSAIKTSRGDLDQRELAQVMEDARAIRGAVVPVLEHVGNRKTIVFAASVAHAHAIAGAINVERPGRARALDGTMKRDVRREILQAYTHGDVQFVVNVDVLTEGFDAPTTSCIVNAAPTKSRAKYVQRIGRGTRLAEGKTNCLVLDVTGMAGKHRLVGPADALAGALLDDDVRAEINALFAAGERDIDEATEQARRDAERARMEAARAATVRYHVEKIDPFVGSDNQGSWLPDGQLATEQQCKTLDRLGAKKLPPELGQRDAARLIERLVQRARAGLCSLGQARQLARAGIDTRHLRADRAQAMCLQMKAHGWDPAVLSNEPEAIAARGAQSEIRKAS